MECGKCGTENPETAKFCNECGDAMPRPCASCGFANPPKAKFCNECGEKLGASARSDRVSEIEPHSSSAPPSVKGKSEGSPTSLRAPEAERRQLTVMFCDLVGSTQLSSQLDPEDLREVIRGYQAVCEEVIQHYEGHVAQYLGDGVLAYFGYPSAHEDDPQRAVRTALEILQKLTQLNQSKLHRDHGISVSARIGIHTGPTVVGTVGGVHATEQLAVGETPNIAARIQSHAPPDSVLVSGDSVRLMRNVFDLESCGRRKVDAGLELELHRVMGFTRSRIDEWEPGAANGAFLGRDAELSTLSVRFEEVSRGGGRTVCVVGDAGIGKSALIRAFRARLGDRPHRWLQTRSSSYHADTALHPVGELIRQAAPHIDSEAPQAIVDALTQEFRLNTEHGQVLRSLLGDETEGPLNALPPQVRRARILEGLCAFLFRLAEDKPTLICVEDLHWTDHSTLELLAQVAERIHTRPLLLLMTTRPQFAVPWNVDTSIQLNRLPSDQVMELVKRIADAPLPAELLEQIVRRADGNPLFVEELTKMVTEAGNSDALRAQVAIPATLQDSLMARLDRLAPAKTIVQVGASVGREFPFQLMQELLELDPQELEHELARLTSAELLYRRGEGNQAIYTFKHALIQDAAYQSLTRRTRREYHGRIAQLLSNRFTETPPPVLAHHHTEAGNTSQAALLWHDAAQRALREFALAESINHLERGLALLATDVSADNDPLRLSLRVTLGAPLMLTRGFAAPEVEAHYAELYELCQRNAGTAADQLFPALWGLWTFYEVSGVYPKAQRMGEELLELAERSDKSGIRLAAHTALGAARFMRGEVAPARRAFETGLELYDPQQHAELALLFGQDAGAMCASFLTWVHAHDGHTEKAKQRVNQALQLSEQLGQPSTRGFVECVLATHFCLVDEFSKAKEHSETVIRLGNEQGMPHWAAQGQVNRGWAVSGLGNPESGVEDIRMGISALMAIGTRAAMTYFNGGLAASELARGDVDAAQNTLGSTFDYVEASDERLFESELHRLHGELMKARGDMNSARSEFARAEQVAAAQGAVALANKAKASAAAL
ncbi:MAG: AAA family ATPase [Polyangiaceae bacterium]|nr:AAA family ATPase [Myxococcales bacterium]MCB9588192.1 AAA family ATPase [Polyangiaceae bacterium]